MREGNAKSVRWRTEGWRCLFRPLDPLYAERWQTVEVGKRGGLEVRPPFKLHVAITPKEYFQARTRRK